MAGERVVPAHWRESRAIAFGIAVAGVLAVTALKVHFPDWLGQRFPVTAYLAAVMVAACFGGTLPGLVATTFFLLLAGYFVVAPYASFAIAWPRDGVRLFIGGIEGAVISALAGELRSARLAARRRSAELVRQAAELDRANDGLRRAQRMGSVGQLAAGAVHDFNNWLAIVLTYSEMLLPRVQNDPHAAEYARELLATGRRAANLSARLLAFSRPAQSRATTADLNRVLRDIEPMLRKLLPSAVELETSYDDHIDQARADVALVEQVIVNLVSNAADAIEGRGTISVSTARAGDAVEVSVRDTGVGMDEATKARIFEAFFTTKAKGTGLGLTMVRTIVEEGGGTLEVESAPGAGSTFRVRWPAATNRATAHRDEST